MLKPHKSFVDFIISARNKCFPIDVSKSHCWLVEGCLRILLDPEDLHFNMACIKSMDEVGTGKAIVAPDLGYTCYVFLDHVASAADSDAFIPQLLNFLKNQLLFWPKALELLGFPWCEQVSHGLKLSQDRTQLHVHFSHLLDNVCLFMECFQVSLEIELRT